MTRAQEVTEERADARATYSWSFPGAHIADATVRALVGKEMTMIVGENRYPAAVTDARRDGERVLVTLALPPEAAHLLPTGDVSHYSIGTTS